MSRPRLIPDAMVFATVRQLLAKGGDKAVAFSAVAQATGLAAPSLAQRYGSRDGMVRAALLDGWDLMDAAVVVAAGADTAQGFLKALGVVDAALLTAGFRDSALRDRAAAWRAAVETGLARHFGGGDQGARGGGDAVRRLAGRAGMGACGGPRVSAEGRGQAAGVISAAVRISARHRPAAWRRSPHPRTSPPSR